MRSVAALRTERPPSKVFFVKKKKKASRDIGKPAAVDTESGTLVGCARARLLPLFWTPRKLADQREHVQMAVRADSVESTGERRRKQRRSNTGGLPYPSHARS